MPRVSIVAVTWNRRDCIDTLLSSLKGLDYPNYEVVVVDNASCDGTVEMLSDKYPEIVLIANEENLGGSGGFNCGMRHVLAKGGTRYIWLLDNDAEVYPETLKELVAVLDDDHSLGVAGSAIVNPDEPGKFVELGVNINWGKGFVAPFYENCPVDDVKPGVYEVDFVPACSALVRTSLLDPGRLMDERYFLWWDDADFCCTIREQGAKVVCVTRSIVRHPTEKSRAVINYYNLRNALLFFAKHSSSRDLLSAYATLTGSAVKVVVYNYLTRRGMLGMFLWQAIKDFYNAKWGRYDRDIPQQYSVNHLLEGQVSRIVVMPSSNLENILRALEHLRRNYPLASVDLMIQTYRSDLFAGKGFDGLISFNDRSSFFAIKRMLLFISLLVRGYDVAVNADPDFISPFSFAARRHVSYDNVTDVCVIAGTRSNLWRLVATLLLGWLFWPLMFPVLMLRGLRYRYE